MLDRGSGISCLLFNLLLLGSAWGQPPPDPLVAALDKDNDGTVSASELEQAAESLQALDKNQDGKLTFDEIMPEFPPFGPPGFGPPGVGGGFGPRMEKRELVADFDKDGDERLNREERTAARASLEGDRRGGRPRGRGPGGRFGRGGERDPASPGPRVAPADVQAFPNAPLYDTTVLRTLFLDFEHDDWRDEMAEFKDSDVDVPAALTVDGKAYPHVGVHFRGMSSFMMVPEEYKRSLNLSIDFVDDQQRLYGYRTLNLLNCAGDPSLMSTALYAHIASQFIPVPKANFVKVVINGESWGIYANVQQFNKDFVKEHYGTGKGSRWKVRGNPGADGGLRYFGDNLDEYKQRFQLKSSESDKAWRRLVELCRILEETPADELEAALQPIIDVDQLLWFLALDVALVNSDGYWTRASDYSLYLDKSGKFHVIPSDINEAFHGARRRGPGPGGPGGFRRFGPPGAPGGPPDGISPGGPPEGGTPEDNPPRRGRRGGFGFGRPHEGGIDLDPLVNVDNPRMPLRAKVLAVPRLRQQYLQNMRTIADAMSWERMGPVVRQMRELIDEEVKADTRKLSTYDAFVQATGDDPGEGEAAETGLRFFFDGRRKYLLEHPEIAALPSLSQEKAARSTGDLKSESASGIVINELMAVNNSIQDADGHFDDWIELLNTTDQEIDLTKVSLSDNEKKLRKWTFPAATKIGPGEYLLIWADNDVAAEKGLHASFKLSKTGESLFLSCRKAEEDVLLDRVDFGRQKASVSFGALPRVARRIGRWSLRPARRTGSLNDNNWISRRRQSLLDDLKRQPQGMPKTPSAADTMASASPNYPGR